MHVPRHYIYTDNSPSGNRSISRVYLDNVSVEMLVDASDQKINGLSNNNINILYSKTTVCALLQAKKDIISDKVVAWFAFENIQKSNTT